MPSLYAPILYTSHYPNRIREETLESVNLFRGGRIPSAVPSILYLLVIYYSFSIVINCSNKDSVYRMTTMPAGLEAHARLLLHKK